MAILTSSAEQRQIAAHTGLWRAAMLGTRGTAIDPDDAIQIAAQEVLWRAEFLARLGAGGGGSPDPEPTDHDNDGLAHDDNGEHILDNEGNPINA